MELSFLQAIALDVELDDHRVMDESVDRGGGGHGVLEDLLPARELEIGAEQDAAPFVTFGQQGEEDFHLFAALLNVTQVVDNQRFELLELLDDSFQAEVPFGSQQFLDQHLTRREVDRASLASQLVPQRTEQIRFARTGPPKDQHVVPPLQEIATAKRLELLGHMQGQARPFELLPALALQQLGVSQQAGYSTLLSRLTFLLDERRQELRVRPVVAGGLVRHRLMGVPERGES